MADNGYVCGSCTTVIYVLSRFMLMVAATTAPANGGGCSSCGLPFLRMCLMRIPLLLAISVTMATVPAAADPAVAMNVYGYCSSWRKCSGSCD